LVDRSLGGDLPIALPVTVDLMKVATSLRDKVARRKLVGCIRTAWTTQSCLADLRQAAGACDAIDALSTTSSTLDGYVRTHLQSATLASAIIMYVRATTSGGKRSGERGSVQIDPAKLTKRQQEDHGTLVRIRNSALGHVEVNADIAGDYWHRDLVFAKRSGAANWEVASSSHAIGFHKPAFEILKRQVPVAIEHLKEKCRQRIAGVIEMINELKLCDADLMTHQVNPIEWFGSARAAVIALGTKPGEEASGWTPLI